LRYSPTLATYPYKRDPRDHHNKPHFTHVTFGGHFNEIEKMPKQLKHRPENNLFFDISFMWKICANSMRFYRNTLRFIF